MRNRDVKYLREVESGAELMFALEKDPGERTPQNQHKPDILQKVRDIVAPDLLSLSKQTGITPASPGADTTLEQAWTSHQ